MTDLAVLSDYVAFFDYGVLARYKNDSHKYLVQEDDFEGKISVVESYYLEQEKHGRGSDAYIDVIFGYQLRNNGEYAIAVFVPDFREKLRHHIQQWSGFLLTHVEWPEQEDTRFLKWKRRYLEGCWLVDNGPLFHIRELLSELNALTIEAVSIPLFDNALEHGIRFPAAENTHRFEDAHLELYVAIIDGLDIQCIRALGRKLLRPPRDSGTLKALTEVFPSLAEGGVFSEITSQISAQRRKAAHKVRLPSQAFPAFSTFDQNVKQLLLGLQELGRCLEDGLNMTGRKARARQDAISRLPPIVGPSHALASVHSASQMIGKTVERVEAGVRKEIKGVHSMEAIHIHFTDGTILGIDMSSNVRNFIEMKEQSPEQLNLQFMLEWVPRP